jgi:hypothetical protein
MPGADGFYHPDQSIPDPDPCIYRKVYPQPRADSVFWHGNDPLHGRLWDTVCPDALYIDERDQNGNNRQADTYMGTYYVPDGVPPGQGPEISPMSLVSQAIGNLTIPTPTPHVGPDANKIAVKVPTWLWIDYAGPITVTTTAGALSATVTATLDSTTWQMGEPVDVHTPGVPAAPVTCAGAGTAYAPGLDPKQPPCGYTYIWKSLPERTGGTGTWTVTATAHWTVNWSVSTGLTGSQQVATTAQIPLLVREWHVVLVDKAGG